MQGHRHYDCSEYCDDCFDTLEDIDENLIGWDQGEQDTPAHCSICHCPLDHRLTTYGVEYVLDALASHEASPRDNKIMIGILPYYEGSRHIEVLRDWAEHLSRGYYLTESNRDLVNNFLDATEAK